jgi:hypothetical protein
VPLYGRDPTRRALGVDGDIGRALAIVDAKRKELRLCAMKMRE